MFSKSKGLETDVQAFVTATRSDVSECRIIFKQLKEDHEDTIKNIDDELGRDGTEVKMGVT